MGDIPMERKDLIIKIVEDCINELHGSHNTRNLTALAKKHHKEDEENYHKIDPEHQTPDEVQKRLKGCVKEINTRVYAEKNKIPLNCSFRDKLNYIKETIAGMFDFQPIQVVGKEHPAKENLKKDKKKEDKCQEQ